jgi:PBP1b-binding outer membrane lipoprotein LpoB
MKWSNFYAFLFFAAIFFSSCSDNADTKDSPTTNESVSSTPTNPSVAEQKRSDVAVQGLKGKVEVMSESILPGDGSKKMVSKNVFKYDANGNMVELSNYKADGKVTSTIRSTYEASGKLIKEETILGDGTVDLVSAIKTDAKGNKIEQEDVRPMGNIIFNYKYYYKYDEKGQLTERIAYRGNGTFLFKYVFKYDDNGNRIEWIQQGQDSSVVGKVIYKYNEKNNLAEQTEYKGDGSVKAIYTYSYEFDKKGNWLRRKKMQDGKVVEIKERDVKYY